ncbi:MAG TPA: TIGR03621 family F420-dependent LLM class oxidoreductase [Nocardiopsis listeri]|uniref:TIGR03621 family F420-dependent LLM class oxidoreductase n=1 Tax=Nocardiopsis listeri TaxID=53440 RepID=UPI001D821424|nr:TIGR03621 family F420-dependent LLM class oxidoreductase [Nocardiopsis listeri]HJE56985.1 TIGR03621 family F420-dependent LLM class oxidoreductase [Nocardiopsis listeri]
MLDRRLRFGVVLISSGCTAAEWAKKCARAEALGYDVIGVPDHLNLMSPFPSAVAAGSATSRPRIAAYVINGCFYNHALLARDVATTDLLLDGRLEIGIGTGYVEHEFVSADIEFGSPGSRVRRLEGTLSGLREFLDSDALPHPAQRPHPPLMIGGHGERVLRLASHEAEIVGFTGARFRPEYGRTGLVDAPTLEKRVDLVRAETSYRPDGVEFNVLSKATVLTGDRRAAADRLRERYGPDLTIDQVLELPTVFVGRPRDIAEQLESHTDRFGITYYTVMEAAMEDFGKVIELVR